MIKKNYHNQKDQQLAILLEVHHVKYLQKFHDITKSVIKKTNQDITKSIIKKRNSFYGVSYYAGEYLSLLLIYTSLPILFGGYLDFL